MLMSLQVAAVVETYEFDRAEQRESYVTLSEELRCPKCQNQNLADSNAEIAQIMREVIVEEIKLGHSEQAIKDLMVERYGEFVLYEPPVVMETLVLWWAPVLFLLIAALAFVYIVFKRSRVTQEGVEGDASS